MPTIDDLSVELDRLASFDPGPFPVLSLYLDLRADQHGRDNFAPFLRKELTDRVRTYAAGGPERESLEQDAAKIRAHMEGIDPAVNSTAIFACAGAGLFDAVTLAAPIERHRLYVSDQPHLYPLARLIDQYRRYAALVADTRSARIFVFAANAIERAEQIEGRKTKRHKMGGWSQARYQRHTENYHVKHAKEVVDALIRIVRSEGIEVIVIAGDESIAPLLKAELPKDLAERTVDVTLDARAPEHEVLQTTVEALREVDARTDRDKVQQLLDAYRSNALAVVGVEATRTALELGEVDELVIAAGPEAIVAGTPHAGDRPPDRTVEERAADELVAKARQTAARITFVEDVSLLAPAGGVGALLRFKAERP
jgi:peptide subunit release factor 1 (eRF1)